jgi:photosystem II stability/assembly factor-like uncharacterized protein
MRSTKLRMGLIFAFVSTLAAAPVRPAAGPPVWQAVAPTGGSVIDLAVDPRSGQVFASTPTSGVYRSDDRGQTWASAGSGLPAGGPFRLAAGPGAVYAWAGDILYKTTDGGGSWVPTGYSGGIGDLAIAPSAPNILYIAHYTAGFLRSEDGGATWQNLTANLPGPPGDLSPNTVAVDLQDPETVYVATVQGSFLKSSDGGGHWTTVGALDSGKFYSHLLIDPGAPTTFYALGGSLYRSTDRGATWKRLAAGFPSDGYPNALAALGGPVPRLYTTVIRYPSYLSLLYASRDHGQTWQLLKRAPLLLAVAVDPAHPRRLYTGTSPQGVLWSADSGAHFTQAAGVRDAGGVDVAMSPTTAGEVYLVTSLGAQKSTDGGTTWTALGPGLTGAPYRVRPDRRSPGTLYGATRGGDASLYKSADDGRSWQATALPKEIVVEDLAIDPQDPRHLLAAGWLPVTSCGIDCVETPTFEAFQSADAGATWTSFGAALVSAGSSGLYRGARFDPANPRTVFLFGDQSFLSTDGGATWAPLPFPGGIKDLALDPSHPNVLVATGFAGLLFRSVDSGRSWTQLSPLPFSPGHLAFDTHAGGRLYASGISSGAWLSLDSGTTWENVSAGLPYGGIGALASDPFQAGRTFALTPAHGGLFRLDFTP